MSRQSTLEKFLKPSRNQNGENGNIMEIQYNKDEDLALRPLKLNQIEMFNKAKTELFEDAKKLLEENGHLNHDPPSHSSLAYIKDIKPKRVNKVKFF